jgi:hypothetical protein
MASATADLYNSLSIREGSTPQTTAPFAGNLGDHTVEALRPEINALESKLGKKEGLLIIAMMIVMLVGIILLTVGASFVGSVIPPIWAFPILFTGVGLVGSGIVIGVINCSVKLTLNPYAKEALDDPNYREFTTAKGLIPHLNTLIRTYRIYRKQHALTQSLDYVGSDEHRHKHQQLLDFRRTFSPSAEAIRRERFWLGSAGRSLTLDQITQVIKDRRSNELVHENDLLLTEDFGNKTVELLGQQAAIDKEIQAIKDLDTDTIADNRLILRHWSEKDKDY